MIPLSIDAHWLDFYAFLGVPTDAGEDAIRKCIGKLYSEAAANSDHRDLARRHYFQALIERVLPQCRRVLLDAKWRAQYDQQHQLHQNGDPAAQSYVAFIAGMRAQTSAPGEGEGEVLPQRVQDDINLAREVVECARQGAQLELLPTRAVSSRETAPDAEGAGALESAIQSAVAPDSPSNAADSIPRAPQTSPLRGRPDAPPLPLRKVVTAASPSGAVSPSDVVSPAQQSPFSPAVAPTPRETSNPVAAPVFAGQSGAEPVILAPNNPPTDVAISSSPAPFLASNSGSTAVAAAPVGVAPVAVAPVVVAPVAVAPVAVAPVAVATLVPTPIIEEIVQSGEAVRAQVISGEEAAAIRRERAATVARESSVQGQIATLNAKQGEGAPGRGAPRSRFSVGEAAVGSRQRAISPNSLNLLVAIVGVLLTLTVQHFSNAPAVANGAGRVPIFVAVAPQMEAALGRAEAAWEQTPGGSNFDVVVQPVTSQGGLSRALGSGAALPDAWIPADASWIERYNRRAPGLKRQLIGAGAPLAQSPLVLMARRERAGELRRLFPNHQISSWHALRGAVTRGAAGHLGLSDPQKTESGALSRVSMAREWALKNATTPVLAAKNPAFWQWMAAFEENSPSASSNTGDMVKDLARGTTGRFWWVVAYESDALRWMSAGKNLEIFYLPRTALANYPFCALERVGAGSDVAVGRAAFEKFLRSAPTQKALLDAGFRPTEINLKTRTQSNPFLSVPFRAQGARSDGLPLEERANIAATEVLAQQWGKRFG